MEESKFNFSEEEKKDDTQAVSEKKEAVKKEAKGFFISVRDFLHELLDFREDTDREATVAAIKADIPFKGATAWILICSIFVASIGLNANSTAVVIGAMLISPLMGPILGLGLSIATNDVDTLKRSLTNLLIMIVLSLLTAFLFFYIFPLSEDTSELIGRVRPDIRDVLIAFFGGSALMIARTKKGTVASVIFGVAIATALMPPLCTAGYGLAIGNFDYFFGAMYLFLINTIFIGLASFLVLKILRFPMQKYANSVVRRRTAQVASVIAIIVMIPAILTFLKVYKESKFEHGYKQFLKEEVSSNDDLWLQRDKMDMEEKTIKLFFNGEINNATITDLTNELKRYDDIKDFKLIISSNKSRSAERIIDLYDKATVDLEEKGFVIEGLQKQVVDLKNEIEALKKKSYTADQFSGLAKDAKIRFGKLESIAFSKMLASKDFIKVDTVATARVKWNKSLNDSLMIIEDAKIKAWLQKTLKVKSVEVIR